MSMKRIRRAVASNGTYVHKGTGQTKRRYVNVGTLFKRDDDGSLSLKLEVIPIGPDFDGWINFYEIEDKPKPAARSRQQAAPPPVEDFDDDDIPF